jgi:hypothetical protein
VNDFSIAVVPAHLSGTGIPEMEKHSAAFAAVKATPNKLYRGLVYHSIDPLAEGLCHFAFRRLSEKQNKKNNFAFSAALR